MSAASPRLLPVLLLAGLALGPAAARAQFRLGLQDPSFQGTAAAAQSASAYGTLRRVGGSVVRMNAYWSAIEPAPPAGGSRPQDPANPAYRWHGLDTALRRAESHRVRVLLMLFSAPSWAQGPRPPAPLLGVGTWDPDPKRFALFARAVAQRYNGRFPDPRRPGHHLPRVRDFEVWNEENLPTYFQAPDVVIAYRALLSAGYAAIKAVHRDNRVAIGGFAPVSYIHPLSVSPLRFAAALMCLRRAGRRFVRVGHCRSAPFDALAEHPYTLAVTPSEPATSYDDVLVADLPKLRSLLEAAQRLRTIGPGHHALWITEWSWITDPPDRRVGDSPITAARYVAYSMYEIWKAGASLVIWQEIRDLTPTELVGGGLETRAGRPKPSLRAFRFPFVATVTGRHGDSWGRVPTGSRVRVLVQRRSGRHWLAVGQARPGRDGVFALGFVASGQGTYRAWAPGLGGSLPYYSGPIPARSTHTAFSAGHRTGSLTEDHSLPLKPRLAGLTT